MVRSMHKRGDGLCVVWTQYQRRAESICQELGYEVWYCPPPFEKRALKPLSYLIQSAKMLVKIVRSKPAVVWFQMPPNFLVFIGDIAVALTGRRTLLVADCHNASLRKPWSTSPLSRRSLSHAQFILVHNAEVYQQALELGIDEKKLLIVEDLPASPVAGASRMELPHPYAIVPCSFHPDEPILELLETARLRPDIHFMVTGNLNRARLHGFVAAAPENVHFVGFLDQSDYDYLLINADIVMGLTKYEGIQLSVAAEGLGAERPMVLSKTQILQKMFKDAACYTTHEPKAMAASISTAIEQADALVVNAKALKAQRIADWRATVKPILRSMKVQNQ